MFDNVYLLLVNEQGRNNEEEDGALTSYPNHFPDRLRFRVACAVNLRSDIGFKVRYIIVYIHLMIKLVLLSLTSNICYI